MDKKILSLTSFQSELTKDVQRMLTQFGSLGSNANETNAIISTLKDLDALDTKFIMGYLATMERFSQRDPAKVQVSEIWNNMQKLQEGQTSVVESMKKNIRLLSIDNSTQNQSVMNMMVQVMSNQVAIFEKPLKDVPYFEKVRSSYLKLNNYQPLLEKIKLCMMGNIK